MKRLKGEILTDRLWSTLKSLRSNVFTQLYTHKCGFNEPYHLQQEKKEQVVHSLANFIYEYGSLDHFKFNIAAVKVGSKTISQDDLQRADIRFHVS